jgi:glycosyltransferase involved in cell wall biosynthesis
MKRKNILVVCDGLPYPPNDGVRTRVYNISRQLLKEFNLKIICIVKDKNELVLLPEAQKMLDESVMPVAVKFSFNDKLKALIKNLFQVKPLEYHFYYFDEVAVAITNLLQNEKIDFVQFERSILSVYNTCIPTDIPSVINLYDFESLRHKRLLKIAPPWKKPLLFYNLKRIQAFEKNSFSRSSHIFAISEKEKKVIAQEIHAVDKKVSVLTGGIDTETYSFIDELPRENNIIFVGSGMKFNYDAIEFFYYQVLPHIKATVSDIKWYIVGKLDTDRLRYLVDDPYVEFFPNAPSVIPYYQKCKLLVVPLRGGGGTRLKILESMAIGRSIVSTSVGCEGIDVINNENILIADNADEFALAVCNLLVNNERNNQIRLKAYEFVRKYFAWNQACVPLVNYYKNNIQ